MNLTSINNLTKYVEFFIIERGGITMIALEKENIKKMQDNLYIIRRAAGWTSEKLADLLGVTKQTISNIENNRNILTKTLFLLLCYILEEEIKKRSSDDILILTLSIVFNDTKLTDEQKQNALMFIDGVTREKKIDKKRTATAVSLILGGLSLSALCLTTIIGLNKKN